MGMINESQMNLLKDELIQLYSVHYTENQHQDIDIRHIYQHPTASESAETILARIN